VQEAQEDERVAAEHHGDRVGLAPVEVLLPLNAAVLVRWGVVAEASAIMNHDAVGAQVDPAVVRVAGDVERAGPDVPAAVQRMPPGVGNIVMSTSTPVSTLSKTGPSSTSSGGALWIAKEAGTFDNRGLNVDLQLIDSSKGIAALLSG
jgi:hypothetical protein